MKIVWKIAEAPSGRYRSFHKRSWPMAYKDSVDGPCLFMLQCEDAYRPANAKDGTHAPLELYIADYSVADQGFKWRKLKRTFATLAEVKETCKTLYEQWPNFAPKDTPKD